jgi:ADP-ribose pyrophosphatase YjhB (NUDIX family)
MDANEAKKSFIPDWLKWARQVQAIGQTGLFFSQNEFDRVRYQQLVELASEMMSTASGLPQETFQADFQMQRGYATPKVDVRAAVFRDNRVLLVRERQDGRWSLPGGYADVNDAPASMVEREAWEESGYRVKAVKVAAVFEANHDRQPVEVYHAYKVIFLCDLVGGEPQTSYETTAVDFFALDNLPELSPNRTQPRYIHEAYAHLQNPNRPSAFD